METFELAEDLAQNMSWAQMRDVRVRDGLPILIKVRRDGQEVTLTLNPRQTSAMWISEKRAGRAVVF